MTKYEVLGNRTTSMKMRSPQNSQAWPGLEPTPQQWEFVSWLSEQRNDNNLEI